MAAISAAQRAKCASCQAWSGWSSISARSWPAQKMRPAPVRMITRAAGSASTWWMAASSASIMARDSALALSGRLSVSVATPSARLIRTGSSAILIRP